LENISKEAKLEEQSWRFKRIHYYTSVDLLLLHSMKCKSLFYLLLPTHAANEKGANQIKHKKKIFLQTKQIQIFGLPSILKPNLNLFRLYNILQVNKVQHINFLS
jgi:hypothetical protein